MRFKAMASGQFQIPSYEQSLDSQLVEAVESSFAPTDVQEMNEKVPFYDNVKAIEAKLDGYRQSATEANLPKTSAVEQARAALKHLLERL
jgi:hypothetical protein